MKPLAPIRRASTLALASRYLACGIVKIYRTIVSPVAVATLGPACRFEPSCSVYAGEAIARYGVARGGWQALKRLMRCRPGGGWGYDPVVKGNVND
jgi:putative membrane protein insertion efficiency factor